MNRDVSNQQMIFVLLFPTSPHEFAAFILRGAWCDCTITLPACFPQLQMSKT